MSLELDEETYGALGFGKLGELTEDWAHERRLYFKEYKAESQSSQFGAAKHRREQRAYLERQRKKLGSRSFKKKKAAAQKRWRIKAGITKNPRKKLFTHRRGLK